MDHIWWSMASKPLALINRKKTQIMVSVHTDFVVASKSKLIITKSIINISV